MYTVAQNWGVKEGQIGEFAIGVEICVHRRLSWREQMKYFAVLITLMRDRKNFLDDIRQDIKLESKILALLIASTLFLAIYGAIIGASSGGLQIISSAIKLPALYLITLAICLPTLYFFDILFGSILNFRQYVAMSLTAVGVISVLLFSSGQTLQD